MPAQAAGTQNIVPANNLSIRGNLPQGQVKESYNAVLAVGGGNIPYHFSVKTGALPPGITLDPTTGRFSGTPTVAGNFPFEVIVTDSPRLDQGSQQFNMSVTGTSTSSITLGLSPASATITSSHQQQFTATVSGTVNSSVTWSTTIGAISASGLYTAPVVTVQTTAIVTATSNADSSKTVRATVTINPQSTQTLQITTSTLYGAQQGVMYMEGFNATGGTTPYTWSISSGTAPAGILMSPSGVLAGISTATGTFNFGVTVEDALGKTASGNFSLVVAPGGNFDGPAELPRTTVPTAMSDTPAPGPVIQVNASGDPQAAINSAQCGDTIELQAGATYTGMMVLPAKQCDDQHWIVIRTSAPDSALPPEGQRLTPCYAGVPSLPNRPPYACTNPQNVLAKISRSVNMGSGPVIFQNGANHYRLLGLEITRPVDKVPVVALISPGQDVVADHIIIDRSWIHGTAQDETRRGVALRGTTNVAVVDSYFNDFHCTSVTGTCTDSSTMGGGTGNNPSGTWKIENNFLEAAGENILFGGAASTIVPSDITIRHNHFYKVPQWQRGTPGFVGGYGGNPFVVKNLFEIKNGMRILFEGNILEYTWGGFSQSGQSILITPRNASDPRTGQTNQCSVCEATDITVRYNKISHSGAGINIANLAVSNIGAQAGERYSIHDLVVDDIDADKYSGGGGLFLVMNYWPNQTLNNLSIRHVTGFPDVKGHVLGIANSLTYPQMYGFNFSDNLVLVPTYPVWSAGGTNSCAVADVPVTVITTCFKTFTFNHNVFVGATAAFPASKWPTGNFFTSSISNVALVNYSSGNGGDYHLQANSPYKGKASDGRDPGCDIDALNAEIQGVE